MNATIIFLFTEIAWCYNLTADSVLIRYLRLGIEDGHIILLASQDDATAQWVFHFVAL